MKKNVIKWTWFHRDWLGKNRVVQNSIIDSAMDKMIARMFFEEEFSECLGERKFILHKRVGYNATFILRNGDYVNLRLES